MSDNVQICLNGREWLTRQLERKGRSDFKVLRPPHDDPEGTLAWRPLRKGVADLHRRAEVPQRTNEAYLEALAANLFAAREASVKQLLAKAS